MENQLENQIKDSQSGNLATTILESTEYGYMTCKITPELAEILLKHNNKNRSLRIKKVMFYAEEMKNGNWKMNGENLIFSRPDEGKRFGQILSGQHRLMAVIQSEKTIQFGITYGVDIEYFSTIDNGIKRSPSDILDIEGYKYSKIIAAGIKEFISRKKGYFSSSLLKGNQEMGNETVLEIAESYPKEYLYNIATIVNAYYKQDNFLSKSYLFGSIVYLESVNHSWKKFFDAVYFSNNIEKGSIPHLLTMLMRKNGSASKMDKLKLNVKKALFNKAYNTYVGNISLKRLQIQPSEKFQLIGAVIV